MLLDKIKYKNRSYITMDNPQETKKYPLTLVGSSETHLIMQRTEKNRTEQNIIEQNRTEQE